MAGSILNKKANDCLNPLDHVNLCFNIFRHVPLKYIGWPIELGQLKQEIGALLSILRKQPPHVMLEIGTLGGGTLFLFSRVAASNAALISLDLPGGEFGGGYEDFKVPFFTNFAQKNQHVFLIRDNSHFSSSLSKVKSILKGQKLDFLFIDADHTYEGVKKDFQMYSPLVRKGGLIAFHDICVGPPERVGEVNKFWNEIKSAYKYEEIVDDPLQKEAGIGVLYI